VASYLKKLAKHCSEHLAADEQFEGALFARPAGTISRSVGFGAAGLAGAVVSERAAKKRREGHEGATDEGSAAAFPAGDVALGLTHRRMLVFKHSQVSGKPKEMLAEYPLDQVAGMSQEKRKLHRSFHLHFVDGSLVDLDVVKMAKPEEFIDAFGRLTGR
jgi:hypothetical protein